MAEKLLSTLGVLTSIQREWLIRENDIIQVKEREKRKNSKYSASLCSMQDTGCLGLVHWDDPERWGGWWEGGSGLGTRVHPWWIHVDVWQNQYSIVK